MSDSGPGIPLEDRDKLFLPHFSTKVTGMGLGLPIVSEIATEHGGTVSIEDNEPRGQPLRHRPAGGADSGHGGGVAWPASTS